VQKSDLANRIAAAINLEEVFSSVAWGRNPRAAGDLILHPAPCTLILNRELEKPHAIIHWNP
jgi:hypothetical protein